MHHYDVAVIGTGPAGQKAATQAAKLGRSVVAIERGPTVGGGALATGTIPSKTLREAVLYLTGFRQRGLYGVSYQVKERIAISDLVYRVNHVIREQVAVVESQLRRNAVDIVSGKASFVDVHTISIETEPIDEEPERITADVFVICAGSEPFRPPQIPFDGIRIFDTDNIFRMGDIPRSMTIGGGGVIGIEYAGMFSALGVRVTVVEMRGQLLDFVDPEIVDALVYHMRDSGVVFRLGDTIAAVSIRDDSVVAKTASNKTIIAESLLYTAGRHGATAGMELETIGIKPTARGQVPVNDDYQTAVPHIYAAGDVIGFPALAATSMEQGRIAVRHALGEPVTRQQDLLPYGIYTVPEISVVGKTERELTADTVPYETGIAKYAEAARGQIVGDHVGRLKLLVHAESRELLGVHIIGEGATELVHIGQMVLAMGGTLDVLINNVFNYPTLAECYKIAALDAFNKLSAHVRRDTEAA
jgi:NAD(P) transhydrogenase